VSGDAAFQGDSPPWTPKNKGIRSAIAAVATRDPFLQLLIDVTKIVEEKSETEDGHGPMDRAARECRRSAIETVINNEVVFEIIRQILADPTLAPLFAEIAHRQELKELVAAAVNRPDLAETLSAVSKADDSTLLCVAWLIRSPSLFGDCSQRRVRPVS
jgi:hypothetical protein